MKLFITIPPSPVSKMIDILKFPGASGLRGRRNPISANVPAGKISLQYEGNRRDLKKNALFSEEPLIFQTGYTVMFTPYSGTKVVVP
jgi:hypothetical protein